MCAPWQFVIQKEKAKQGLRIYKLWTKYLCTILNMNHVNHFLHSRQPCRYENIWYSIGYAQVKLHKIRRASVCVLLTLSFALAFLLMHWFSKMNTQSEWPFPLTVNGVEHITKALVNHKRVSFQSFSRSGTKQGAKLKKIKPCTQIKLHLCILYVLRYWAMIWFNLPTFLFF